MQRQENSFSNISVDNQSEIRFSTGPVQHDLLMGVDFSFQYVNIRCGQGTAPNLDLYAPVYRPITLPAAGSTTYTKQMQNQTGFYAQDRLGIGDFRVSPYITYATSFQPQAGVNRQGAGFTPQTGDQIEVRLKDRPRDLNMLLTAELEATGSITPTINVITALTYQEPLVTRSNTAGEVGSRPVVVPSHLANLFLEKSVPVTDRSTVTLGGGTRYTGPTAEAMPITVPSQMVFDLNARVELERWRLQVNTTNLTDRAYVASCVRATSCSYAMGRAVYATVAYRW